jgi:hypothetical protein
VFCLSASRHPVIVRWFAFANRASATTKPTGCFIVLQDARPGMTENRRMSGTGNLLCRGKRRIIRSRPETGRRRFELDFLPINASESH